MLYEILFLVFVFILAIVISASGAKGLNECLEPNTQCASECVDLQVNANFCGSCEIDCAAISESTGTCDMGQCNCNSGFEFCNEFEGPGPRCVVLGTTQNCSSCGDDCTLLGDPGDYDCQQIGDNYNCAQTST